MTEILNEWLNPKEDAKEEESTTKVDTVVSSELEKSKVSNTSDAFDDLFNS